MFGKIKLLHLQYKKRKVMKELNNYLSTFSEILHDLKKLGDEANPNIRLGGSLVLKLHGLNFSRKSEDLDVIIDNPTKGQKDYIQGMKAVSSSTCVSYGEDNFKITIGNYCLNILNNKTETLYPKVYYTHGTTNYGICSIGEIITAKRGYGRKKDITDFIMLKNENFNI